MRELFTIDPPIGIDYRPGWLAADETSPLFARLLAAIPWHVHRIRLFGREVDSPRLSCWMGDAEAHYRYSGSDFQPQPWQIDVAGLRDRLNRELGAEFNGVLLNLYRDGRDSMGWHRDDEPELGREPFIASISLGAARRFVLKDDEGHRHVFDLADGDLLLMQGDSQRRYRHALPKTAKPVAARINLTFRRVCG